MFVAQAEHFSIPVAEVEPPLKRRRIGDADPLIAVGGRGDEEAHEHNNVPSVRAYSAEDVSRLMNVCSRQRRGPQNQARLQQAR